MGNEHTFVDVLAYLRPASGSVRTVEKHLVGTEAVHSQVNSCSTALEVTDGDRIRPLFAVGVPLVKYLL